MVQSFPRIPLKTAEDIKFMEKACRIAADTLSLLEKNVKPGITTLELDKIAEDYIKTKGGTPAFKGYKSSESKVFPEYPGVLCISVEDEVVHGIPSERKLKDGEILTLDCGVLLDGYYSDTALSCGVGEISDARKKLLRVSEESMYLGIEQAVKTNKIFDISRAIQDHCESHGYSLTRELVGHGIGKKLHEEPAVPNFVPALLHRNRYNNAKLAAGMTICIEPMVHMGKKEVYTKTDGWTICTSDHTPAAHFEHTVLITDGKPVILTARS